MAKLWLGLALLLFACVAQTEAVTEPTEVAALLTMKAAWNNVTRLTSWNDTSDPCDNGWRGIICSLTSVPGNRHVTGIQLPGFWVGGILSPAVGKLTYLTLLDLNSNNMTGPMPAEIVNLNQVQRLVFRQSSLTGELGTWLPKLSTLRIVDMGSNKFTGPIPDELGTSLSTLQVFDCSFCQLSGPIPASVGSLGSLQLLQLPRNNLTGPIPPELGKLGSLQGMNLQNNSLTGPVPESIAGLTNLNQLVLAYNQLTGELPGGILTNANALMRFDGNPLCDIAANAPFCTGAPLPSTGGPGGPVGGGPNGLGTAPGQVPGAAGTAGNATANATVPANATTPAAAPSGAAQTPAAGPAPEPVAVAPVQNPVATTNATTNQSSPANQTGAASLTGPVGASGPTTVNQGSSGGGSSVGLIVGVVVGAAGFLLLVALIAAAIARNRRARRQSKGLLGDGYHSKTTSTNGSDAATRSVKSQILRALHLASPKTLPVTGPGGAGPTYFAPPGAVEGMEAPLLFTFRELQVITNGFSDELLIGEGGFGKVYRAGIKDQAVAIKRLEKQAAFPGKHGEKQFRTEVDVLSRIRHPNLLGLIGYCADGGERALVYPLMANQSLHTQLHERRAAHTLGSWRTRLTIAVQSARALAYLHDEASPPVIHRDFTSSNVLLDGDWTAVVSDFGLAKLLPQAGVPNATQSTRLHGTLGYLAPEYLRGQVTEKNDVYSFGVVLLELLSGRRALVSEQFDLVQWATAIIRGPPPILDKILDLSIKTDIPLAALQTAIRVAASCVETDPKRRPRMADVVRTLGAALEEAYGPDANPARADRAMSAVGPVAAIAGVPEDAAVHDDDARSTGSFDYRLAEGTGSQPSTGSIDVSGEERTSA
ncbi:Protein kinase superfamily protein [Klebsormidium nitens]|uniref:Protein kinase superfamily protein n=1 Tax=Klebsormidium nitens TaxID=105231 RepID=A0A1Y1ICF7_KLENI|nr:Protein kinase superfamily protein [Klebsormidium nitens]|eukprot:GAQ86751.1 Protein kinase superfamily protein [Klebsormidium nitens]